MSGRVVSRFILACGGCGTERPETLSSMDARAEAYTTGWRFPQKATSGGSPSSRTSDVCPDCLPTWQPATSRNGRSGK